MDTPKVVVECDRCRKPVATISRHGNGFVEINGARLPSVYVPAGKSAEEAPRLPPGRYVHEVHASDGSQHAGSEDGAGYGPEHSHERWTLICVGRKHPRYQATVTSFTAEAAVAWASQRGRDRIGMRELERCASDATRIL